MNADGASPILFQLRWSCANLRLRLARSLLTLLGVAAAVALLVGVSAFFQGYRRSLARSMDQLGFEVLVSAKGCPYEAATLFLRGGNIPMYLDESICEAVVEDPAVQRSTRLFMQTLPAAGGRHHFFLGVDASFVEMKPWVKLQAGRWFEVEDAAETVLGYNAATELAKTSGDTLEIPGLPRALRVVGILDRTGTQDDGTVFIPLRTAQKLFDLKDKVTGVGVKIRDIEELPDYLARVYGLPGVQVISLSQAQTVILDLASTARKLMAAVGILAAAGVALALINTLLMSLLERRRELAVLRAVGAHGGFLFLLVLIEAELLSFLGAALGIGLSILGSETIEAILRRLLPFSPPGKILEIGWTTSLLALAAALAAGLACSLYPAFRSAQVKPIQALVNG